MVHSRRFPHAPPSACPRRGDEGDAPVAALGDAHVLRMKTESFDNKPLSVAIGVLDHAHANLNDLDLVFSWDTEVTFKLSVKVKGSKPKEERDLEEYVSMISRWGTKLDKDRIVNYSAHNNNMDLKLVGYKRANRKYPFILQDVKTLKRYKFPTDWVNANFSIEEMVS